MSPEEFESKASSIMEEAAAGLAKLAGERFDQSCDCEEEHELATTAWAVAYEVVDMRHGGPPVLEVLHSRNSPTHAHGMMSCAAQVIQAAMVREIGRD